MQTKARHTPGSTSSARTPLEETIAKLAEDHGENAESVIREIRKGTPVARFVIKLCGLGEPISRNGRAPDDERFKTIYAVVNELRLKYPTDPELFKNAPAELHKLGISGHRGRPMTVKRVREVCADAARYWFEHPADQGE